MAHIGNSPASYFTAVTTDVFSANGTATAFTLSKYVSNLADLEIVVNNIQQNPYSGSYSVSNNTLTFSEAPLAGSNNVVVTYRQATIGSTIPTPNTVGNNALQRDLSFTGNTTTQHLVPAANITYDIGTSTMRYRDLYLSGNTINLGDLKLSTNGTAFSVANATGGVFASALGNTIITGTLTSNATTITGNVSVTGNTTLIGNVSIETSLSNPFTVTSTSGTSFARIKASNTTISYSYLVLDSATASEGYGYIIKNGNGNGNGLANGSLYLWNDAGTDKGVEFVPSGNVALRTSLNANGSLLIRGNIGVGNTTPYNAAWGSNTDNISIGGGKSYGVIHLNGKSGSNTSFSMGAGDGSLYMAYDNVNSRHNMTVSSTGLVQIPYQSAFYATGTGSWVDISAGSQDASLTNVIYNTGNNYNGSTSTFTAPIGGKYLFIAHCYTRQEPATNTSGNYLYYRFLKNGSLYGTNSQILHYIDNPDSDIGTSFSIIIPLSTNDTVKLNFLGYGSSNDYYGPLTSMIGYFLG